MDAEPMVLDETGRSMVAGSCAWCTGRSNEPDLAPEAEIVVTVYRTSKIDKYWRTP
jgi:hypothetical protein